MPFRGRITHETAQAWRQRAETELTRLRSLTGTQLGAEVLHIGFADLPPEGERTRIGLANSLCPDAPPVVGDDDIDLVDQYNALLVPVLSALEETELLTSEPRGRSSLPFYRLTARGRSALEESEVELILSARSSGGRGSCDAVAMATLMDLAQEEFVSLTTYRRSGAPVSVAVWIAPATDAAGGLLVTTTERSGKVKRLMNDPRVQLRPCDRHGAVAADAPTVSGQADIVRAEEDVRRLREAIRVKYGSRMKITAADRGIADPAEPVRVILRITASDTAL